MIDRVALRSPWRRRVAPSGLTLLLVLAAALLATTASAQGQPSGGYGAIAIGSSLHNTLADPQGQLTYHTYTVDVPPGLQQLVVEIDGHGNDIDLAVRFGAEISSYQEPDADYDYADFSADPNPRYALADPAQGVLFIDVINLVDVDAAYTITVTAAGSPAAGGTPPTPGNGDPFVGSFAGDGLSVTIEGGGGDYRGQLELGGQRYPFTARASGATLSGSFLSGGRSFPFSATLQGDTLLVESGGRRYPTLRQGGGPPAPTPTAPAPPLDSPPTAAAGAIPTGSWTAHQDFGYGVVVERTLSFVPPDRYIYVESGDFGVQEEGVYRLEGAGIVFLPYCGDAGSHPIRVLADRLVIGAEDPLEYLFVPGSEVDAVRQVAELDANREPSNARWRSEIPIGPVQPGPTPPDPLRSNDPDPNRIYPGATVFTEAELYTYLSSYSYVMEIGGGLRVVDPVSLTLSPELAAGLDFSRGEWRDSVVWLFYGNGRVYTRSENYFAPTSLDPVTPSVLAVWGRYRLLGEDRVEVLTDAGETLAMELYDGRRTLSHDGFCYQEVTWATEQLEQQTEGLGD